MPDVSGSDPHAQRQGPPRTPLARRAGVWLAWWVLLMSLWVIQDDSLQTDELLAGAGAAAIAATLAELAGYQASTRLRMRIEWLRPALRLPADLVRDTGIVFAALWRQLARGQAPNSGFREVPARFGGQSVEDKTRRALLVGGSSVAPNTLALGLDGERDVMVVHNLVLPREGE
jgi:multisubunit Na+/H+ antiporter MnhE subunit